MATVTAIDPGADAGVACFVDGALFWCGVVHEPTAEQVAGASDVVLEEPQVYRRGRGDPNDLIKLARLVGRWEELGRGAGARVHRVRPRTWKGTVPKSIHNARTLALLSSSERHVVEQDLDRVARAVRHNAIDAVGIGLWFLGRGRR